MAQSKEKRPTPQQKAFFQKYELVPPPTRAACGNLTGYLIAGNGAGPRDFGGRLCHLRNSQRKYIGKSVLLVDPTGADRGRVTVLYLIARLRDDVRTAAALYGDAAIRPLHAVVQDECYEIFTVGIDQLRFDP